MKKIQTLIVIVLSLGILAACGREESADALPSSASESTPVSESAPVDTSPEPPSGSVSELDTDTITEQPEATADDAAENPISEEAETEAQTQQTSSSNRILIAYFTMPESSGVDAVSGASRVLVNGEVQGNMQVLAGMIQSATGGDLFTIETVQQYPGEHNALLDFASDEQSAGARPELATRIDNLADYDTIFLGFPNWWYDMPMPIYSFLEEYDLSGKTIVPFNSHGGSGFSGAIQTIQQMQPGATMLEGFTVSRDGVSGAQGNVESWIQGLGIS